MTQMSQVMFKAAPSMARVILVYCFAAVGKCKVNSGGMSLKNKEKFIKSWGKDRRKGKRKYVLYSISKFTIGFWVIAIIFNLIEGNRFIQVIEYWSGFSGGFIVFFISLFLIWNKNEEKYNNSDFR